MSNKFFDPSITGKEPLWATGDRWTQANAMHQFLYRYTNSDRALPGDVYYFGTDPQRVQDFYRTLPYNLNRNTTNGTTEKIEFNFGSWGAFNNQFLSQDAFFFVGDRASPHTREDDNGTALFQVQYDLYTFRGLRARNYGAVIELQNSVSGLKLYDIYAENVNAILYPDVGSSVNYPLQDIEIDGLHGVNVAVGLALIGAGSSNITIRNFSCNNNTCEDGEFRGLNFGDNCSKILIQHGYIRGGIDNWEKYEPRPIDSGAWVASHAYVENELWTHPVSGDVFYVYENYTSDSSNPDNDLIAGRVDPYNLNRDRHRYGYQVYTQGDAISMEESNADTSDDPFFNGFIGIIQDVHVVDFTDRGFDLKPKVLIEDCSAVHSKLVTLWHPESIARRVAVNSPRKAGNRGATCFLMVNGGTLDNCTAIAPGEWMVSAVEVNGGILNVIGGEYTTYGNGRAFLSGADGVVLNLDNVIINGVLHNGTFTLNKNERYPS